MAVAADTQHLFLIGSEIGVLGLLAFLALMAKSLIFNFALREDPARRDNFNFNDVSRIIIVRFV